jgi:hypothetical protein
MKATGFCGLKILHEHMKKFMEKSRTEKTLPSEISVAFLL